jgi:hypothetical protein
MLLDLEYVNQVDDNHEDYALGHASEVAQLLLANVFTALADLTQDPAEVPAHGIVTAVERCKHTLEILFWVRHTIRGD